VQVCGEEKASMMLQTRIAFLWQNGKLLEATKKIFVINDIVEARMKIWSGSKHTYKDLINNPSMVLRPHNTGHASNSNLMERKPPD